MRNKNVLIGLVSLVAITVLLVGVSYFAYKARAEKSGGSPESNATSYIKATYDSVFALNYGSDAAGGWGDWGAYWNRIRSAAEWAPSGNAAASDDVRNTKTFYSNSRTELTGTYPSPGACSTQQYHDSHASATPGNNCSLTWTTATPALTEDDNLAGRGGRDPRTGLVWSKYLKNNTGVVQFVTTGGSTWSWDATDADNIAVGIKTATQLCSEQGDGWRLPTQTELMQAYLDGAYWNLTNANNIHWSISEFAAGFSWSVQFGTGIVYNAGVGSAYVVRCVR